MSRSVAISLFFAVAVSSLGCGQTPLPTTETRAQAVGEPTDGYPSYEERLVLYFTNRARTEPDAFNPEEPYDPSTPLRYDIDLARAARFHAEHIVEQSCWCEDHSSCCALDGEGDDTTCGGPVTGCGAESSDSRVARWTTGYTGENMARGQTSAWQAVEGWIFSSGHWANINNPTSTRLGVGYYPNAWVQDFGSGGVIPVIGDGIHFADGQATRFGVTYYQNGSGGPRTALAIVEGECHDLDLTYGEPELGAFEKSVTLEPGCHRYYFHFTDGNGDDHTYPSFGSFGISVGGEACPFFIDTRPADTCSPSGQTCATGDTRHCYTGPFGTEDVGACEAGVERCVGGQWTGECRLEVLPTDELCDNAVDDDCNGEVDEGCGGDEDGAPDAGMSDTDAGMGSTPDGETPIKEEPGGCSTTSAVPGADMTFWMIALAALIRRRRKLE